MEACETKVCEGCGASIERGPRESSARFASRRFCSARCAKASVKRAGGGYRPLPDRVCAVCSVKLVRGRRPSGALEDPGAFSRRVYCSIACFGKRPKVKAPIVGWAAAHKRARTVKGSGPCEKCGSVRAETHHRNEDFNDNRPENLQRLCRSCHMREHRSSPKCAVPTCPDPVSGPKGNGGNGYCQKHHGRWKKWGDPMLVKRNQHMPVVRAVD